MSSPAVPAAALEQFRELAGLVHDLTLRAEARAKTTHERFNVFTTLLSAHDEVRLHTRFLHSLLDPDGRHDCGALFLDLFFATLAELPGANHQGESQALDLPPLAKRWRVVKEAARSGHGQIDLLLETPHFGIAIENKIYAAEQEGQLAGYAEYLRKTHGARHRLIYLTLDGKCSGSHAGVPYLRISYAEHILAWLERCLRETYRIVPVNQVLQQYHALVRQLTGQTLETETMSQITDFIQRHPDLVRYRNQIIGALSGIEADFLDRLAAAMMTILRTKGYAVEFRDGLRGGRFGTDPCGAFIITPPPDSVLHRLQLKFWVENIPSYQSISVGVKVPQGYKTLSGGEQRLLEAMNTLLDQEAEGREFRLTRPNPAWPTGWRRLVHPFDDAKLAELIGKTDLSGVAASLCEATLAHIKQVEDAYAKAQPSPVS